jgi:ribosomal protein L40E
MSRPTVVVAPVIGMGGGGGYRHRRGGYSSGGRNTMGIFGILAIVSFIVGIFGLMMMVGGNSTIKSVERDNVIYNEMITKADGAPARQRQATVLEIVENDKGGKWWFTYEVIGDTGKSAQDILKLTGGRALPVYTYDQVKDLEGEEITVAINGTTLSLSTDSIPLSFAGHPVTDDGDYIGAKSQKALGTTLMWIFGAIFALSILANVGLFSFLKKEPVEAPSVENATAKDTFCAYCGAKLNPGDTKCPNCGGIIQK